MYCKKCGKKAKAKDVYCEDCGTKLTKEKKKSFKITKEMKKLAMRIILIVLVIFSTYGILSYVFSPVRIATKYFKVVIENDVDGIYNYIDGYESDLVSKDLLEDKLSDFSDVTYYSVTNIELFDTQAIVEFTYVNEGQENVVYVLLNKTKDCILFDRYEVSSAKVAKDVQVVVPVDSVVTIDGISITDYKTSEVDGFATYNIDYIIAGNYEVEVFLNEVTTKENVLFDSDTSYFVKNIDLEEEVKEDIKVDTINKLNAVYTSLINETSFSSIEDIFSNSNLIEKNYRELKNNLSDTYKLNSLVFNDVVIDSISYYYDSTIAITFYVDYNIDYTYDYYYETMSNNSNNSTTTTITYKLVDGKYEMNEIVDYMTLRG